SLLPSPPTDELIYHDHNLEKLRPYVEQIFECLNWQWNSILIRPGTLTLGSQVYSPVAEGWYPAKHIHEVNTRIERANQLRSRSRAATILVVICFLLMLYALSVVVRQGYSFLKEGTWPSMSLYDGIAQTLTPEAAR